MVIQRRTAVSPSERRKWLEEYENHVGITEISRRARRDIRIVKRNIDVAREERLVAQARVEFFRGRLESHHQDLLSQVDRLKKEFSALQPAPVKFGRLGSTEYRILSALREHVKQQKLGNLLNGYETKVVTYSREREFALRRVSVREKEVTEQNLAGVNVQPWSESLFHHLEYASWSDSTWEDQFRIEQINEGEGIVLYFVYYGGLELTKTPVANAILEPLQKAYEDMVAKARCEWIPLANQMLELKRLSADIIYEFDTLILKRMVGGQCDLCP
jgi:hypothetical protein